MLLALLTGFALSQAFRTVTSTLAHGLQTEFGLSNAGLGAFAGLFGLSFGIAQLLMGIALDKFGLRRTIVCALPLAVAGALLSALAPSYPVLMLGQLLIGVAARRRVARQRGRHGGARAPGHAGRLDAAGEAAKGVTALRRVSAR